MTQNNDSGANPQGQAFAQMRAIPNTFSNGPFSVIFTMLNVANGTGGLPPWAFSLGSDRKKFPINFPAKTFRAP